MQQRGKKYSFFIYNKMILIFDMLFHIYFVFVVVFICDTEVKILVSSAHISLKIIISNVSPTFESKHCPWNFLL